MIYTLTLNPAVDLELQIPQFQFNSTIQAEQSRFDCGGKGFNVSRMLNNLGVDNIAMGFIGGDNGQKLKSQLTQLGIKTLLTEIKEETRTNVSIRTQAQQHIKINTSGPNVSKNELDNLLALIKCNLTAGDWWVLAGSLPLGIDNNIYAELISLIKSAGSFVMLDTSGEALKQGCLAQPTLVKPNLEEAMQLFTLTSEQIEDPALLTGVLSTSGAKDLLISLGSQGVLLVTDTLYKKIESPKIKEVNPTGAGDAMVAAIVWRLSIGDSLEQAVLYGVAAGASTANCTGTNLATLKQIQQRLPTTEKETSAH